jgi:hypothetical protein
MHKDPHCMALAVFQINGGFESDISIWETGAMWR